MLSWSVQYAHGIHIRPHIILYIITFLQVLCGRGNNLHEVETAAGDHYLASMPTKFRRNVWIKRGVCVRACVSSTGSCQVFLLIMFLCASNSVNIPL